MVTRHAMAVLAALAMLTAGCTGEPPPGDEDATDGSGAAVDAWSWAALPDVPTPRTEVAAVVLGDTLYVLGGFAAASTPSNAVEALDLTTNTWSSRMPMPVPLHHAPAVAHDGRIHVLGGYTSAAFVPTRLHFVYDPASDLWSVGPELPRARGAHGAAVVDGQAVLVGGVGDAGLLSAVDVLELGAGTWSEAAELPKPRDHLAVAALDGRVHAIGGRERSLDTNMGTHEAYDLASDTWTTLAPMPTPRGGIGGAAVGSLVMVAGGEEDSGTFDEVEAYDPAADAWLRLPGMPTARHGLGVASHSGSLLTAAGGPEPGLTVSGAVEVGAFGTP